MRTVGKRVRKRSGESELRFKRLFETAQDGILLLDGTTHEILEANPFMAELLGCSRVQLFGKSLSETGILPHQHSGRQALKGLQKSGTVRFEHSLVHLATGKLRELEFVCNRYSENGRPVVQCNIRDIGQRNEGERKLREALRQLAVAKQELEARVAERTADLQQRNGELEAFSYSLSHDLRSPIRAIVSFTQIALDEYGKKVGPPATEFLKKAVASAERLDQLIQDVLSFSKATRQKMSAEVIDVEQLLRDIIQERPEWAPPKVDIHVAPGLLPVRGDRASLTQCLTNLLGNAVKFVPAGVLPQVRVYSESFADRVRLCVEDNGIGIPESAQARVFDLFQRAHNGYQGHGIGLAIVRRAAERMHGSVGLTSKPGKGSTFWVELPGATSR
jgi:PAS domain S-box-containing protein